MLTHDSIGLGEDGPTHQPIEHAASLRLIPGLDVWRPADTTETAVAWTRGPGQEPTAHRPCLLSRQNLAYVAKSEAALDQHRQRCLRAVRAQDVGQGQGRRP